MLLRAITTVAGSAVVAAVLNAAASLFGARLLGPSEFGTCALITAYPLALWAFANVKTMSVTSRYISSALADGRGVELIATCKLGIVVDVALAGVSFLLVAATASTVAGWAYGRPEIGGTMVLFAAALPLYALTGTSLAVLNAAKRFRLMAFLQVLEAGLNLVLSLVLVLAGFGARGFVAATAIAYAAYGLVSLVAADWALRSKGHHLRDHAPWAAIASIRKELASGLRMNYLATTFSGIAAQAPFLLLGMVSPAAAVGHLRVATSLAQVAGYPSWAAARVILPDLSILDRRSAVAELRRVILRRTIDIGVPMALVVALGILVVRPAVGMVLGAAYLPAVEPLRMLMVAEVLAALLFWLSPYFYAVGRVSEWTVFSAATMTCIALGSIAVVMQPSAWMMAAVIATSRILCLLAAGFRAVRLLRASA